MSEVNIPKTLASVFDALIGDIFLDSGNDLAGTWNVIHKLMQNDLERFIRDVPIHDFRELYKFPSGHIPQRKWNHLHSKFEYLILCVQTIELGNFPS